MTEKLTCAMELTGTLVRETDPFFFPAVTARRGDYTIAGYLLYRINSRWSAGTRLEWLNEAIAIADPIHGDRRAFGDLYALTCGLNWTPGSNLLVRPELRWDWSDFPAYDGGTRFNQLLAAVDVVLRF
jgi:hypothetical protein